MNYRSVVLFGTGYIVTDKTEEMNALEAITENIIPGRWEEVRKPSDSEMKGTLVIGFPIEEGSSKIRTGPPIDSKEDYKLDIWAGEIPLTINALEPIPDPQNKKDLPISKSVGFFTKKNNSFKL